MKNEKQNFGLVVGGAIALVVVLTGGAFFFLGGGDKGGSSPVEGTDGPAKRPAETAEGTPKPRPPSELPAAPIETQRYSARHDAQGAVAELEGEKTGLAITGIVLDPEGRPLANASVDLIRDVSAIRARSQDGETLARLRTSETGSFAFENIEANSYFIVQASHQDYTTRRKSPIDSSNAASLRVELRLDAGLEVSGTVHDAAGAVVEGAEVLVYDLNVQTLDPVQSPERAARTGADGKFAVPHLVPGLKKLVARKEGYSSDGRNALDVREGQPLGAIDFTLNQGFEIRGTVVDARTSQPIPGVQITARPVSFLNRPTGGNENALPRPDDDEVSRRFSAGNAGRELNEDEIKRLRSEQQQDANRQGEIAKKSFLLETSVTDDKGNFVLHGLMEAHYLLQVRATGYQANNAIPVDAGTTGKTIALAPSPRLSGRVLDDETGQPVTNFRVAVTANRDSPYIPATLWQRFRDPQGLYEYLDVRPGQQFVVAEADGYAGGRTEAISIAPDQTTTGIEVRLLRGARLRGRVKNDKGVVVSGARVDLVQSTAGAPGNPANPFMDIINQQLRGNAKRRAVTGADGEFAIDGVLAGAYKVRVAHPDFADGESAEFSCENRGDVVVPEVQLRPGATIKGIVRKKSGEPDDRATVMLSHVDTATMNNHPVQTGSDGRFEVKGLKAGTYRLAVTQREGVFDLGAILQGQQNPAQVVTVADGELREVEL